MLQPCGIPRWRHLLEAQPVPQQDAQTARPNIVQEHHLIIWAHQRGPHHLHPRIEGLDHRTRLPGCPSPNQPEPHRHDHAQREPMFAFPRHTSTLIFASRQARHYWVKNQEIIRFWRDKYPRPRSAQFPQFTLHLPRGEWPGAVKGERHNSPNDVRSCLPPKANRRL